MTMSALAIRERTPLASDVTPILSQCWTILPQPRFRDWQNTVMLKYVVNATWHLECQRDEMLRVLNSAHQQRSPTWTQLRQVMEIQCARQLPHDRQDKLSHQDKVLISKAK